MPAFAGRRVHSGAHALGGAVGGSLKAMPLTAAAATGQALMS
jgi:hypothetical protein